MSAIPTERWSNWRGRASGGGRPDPLGEVRRNVGRFAALLSRRGQGLGAERRPLPDRGAAATSDDLPPLPLKFTGVENA